MMNSSHEAACLSWFSQQSEWCQYIIPVHSHKEHWLVYHITSSLGKLQTINITQSGSSFYYDHPTGLTLCSAAVVSSFFLAYSQWLQIGCLPYFHTRCGLIANLECKSKMCCLRVTENTGCKNLPSAHKLTITQLCRVIPSQLRHVFIIGRKNLLNGISPRHLLTIWWTLAH